MAERKHILISVPITEQRYLHFENKQLTEKPNIAAYRVVAIEIICMTDKESKAFTNDMLRAD